MYESDTVSGAFLRPLLHKASSLLGFRKCPSLSDATWLETGVRRALSACVSGRDFLAQLGFSPDGTIGLTHFFETLRSSRRLRLCRAAARAVQDDLGGLQDQLADVPELEGYDVFAGDGHFHAAASHDPRAGDGRRFATGHLYGLDLRSRALIHIATADQAARAKEHDMRALKRTDIETLRQGAPKGRKVIWVWDRAGIDFRQWHAWKQGSGIYIISRAKTNMRPETIAVNRWTRDHETNRGVVSDLTVSTSQGVAIRQVVFRDPATGSELTFITTLTTVEPGVIAQLYRMRWDIEKVFDELKNKLGEKRAWATSENAKSMQAAFLCIAHNLTEIYSLKLEREHGVTNAAEIERKGKVLARHRAAALEAGNALPKLFLDLQRITQHSVKLIRWIRYHLWNETSQNEALGVLRALYAKL